MLAAGEAGMVETGKVETGSVEEAMAAGLRDMGAREVGAAETGSVLQHPHWRHLPSHHLFPAQPLLGQCRHLVGP